MDIPILNIYYLLSYAWDRLDEAKPKEVSQTDNENIINLFAKVLSNRTSHLLSRGLDRGYIDNQEILGVVRGKINITSTISKNLMSKLKVDCTFDELSYNVIHNRILKSTIDALLRSDELTKDIREQLKLSYMKFPSEIEMMSVRKESFKGLQFYRNNFFYDFLMKICELIHDNYLTDEASGKKIFQDFSRDEIKMRKVFESFIERFYKRHSDKHGYKVFGQSVVNWYNVTADDISKKYLPQMRPDIILEKEDKKIILDTKYYKEALKKHYEKKRISSSNLYQMYAYMKNMAANDSAFENCEGILLYPAVDKNFDGAMWDLDGHKLYAKTINLNQDWKSIKTDLINLLKSINN